jgi:glycosyltransferase involved in cell wall biosynthesis
MVYWGRLGSHVATVWLKYLGQTIDTWRLLRREKPGAVFVMSPPPTAALAVYTFCRVRGIPFVIDAHTGAFEDARWRPFLRIHYWLCRRAATTIVTNERLAEGIRRHGGHATIVPDVPVEFPPGNAGWPAGAFTVLCVTSFDRDEPIDAMVEAARRLPDVRFVMTGERSKAERAVGENAPVNLELAGFVDAGTYGGMLRSADVVMTLTTLPNTMQRGAWEAIYQGTPVIVTDSPVLRDAFDEGAVHVDNSAEQIVQAVRRVRADPQGFKRAAARLCDRKQQRWLRTKQELLAVLKSG